MNTAITALGWVRHTLTSSLSGFHGRHEPETRSARRSESRTPPEKVRSNRGLRGAGFLVANLLVGVALVALGPAPVAQAAESISFDFDEAGDLVRDFNSYVAQGTISQSLSGGIGNSGAIQVNFNSTANAVFSTKDGYSLGPVNSTYTFSAQMRSRMNSGWSGMGFTSLTPGASTASGTPFRPNDALGISVHGGGYVFHNGGTDTNGSWAATYNGLNNLHTTATSSGITTGCADGTQDNCWYKVVFKITRTTSTTFTARVELYDSSQSGVLNPLTAISIVELRNQTNTTLTDAPQIFSYLNFSGQRMQFFDDFQVDLAGGASVISAGAPVILTSSASQSSGAVTVGGNVTADGGAAVTDRGFVYATATNPTTANSTVALGSGTGSFTGTTPQLPAGTYYFRAYATNSAGTSYGAQETLVIRGNQTITWSPLTALTLADSGITLAATVTTGDGSLGYTVVSAGTTGCTISGTILSFSSTGSGGDGCEVRPTATATAVYDAKSDAATVTFNISTVAPAAQENGGGGGGAATTPAPAITPPSPARPNSVAPPQSNPIPAPLQGPVTFPGRAFNMNMGTTATIGGALATVTQQTLPGGGLSVAAGAFQLGLALSNASRGAGVDTNNPGNSPEFWVPQGQSAIVNGTGLFPGSQLQVWLPGRPGEASRELARVPVRTNGTFVTQLSFTARQTETPVPVGRQVMQVTGFDSRGEQTVVDMTINVAQGPPTPEPNRREGRLPQLTLGSSLATSAGIPTVANILAVPEQNLLSVGDGQWLITAGVEGQTAAIQGTAGGPVLRLVQGSGAYASGDGFLPGTTASVWMFSDPTLMGTTSVNEDGFFTLEFFVDPQFLAAGAHTLQIQGVGVDGFIKAANLGVLVDDDVIVAANSAPMLLGWVGWFLVALVGTVLAIIVGTRRTSGKKLVLSQRRESTALPQPSL